MPSPSETQDSPSTWTGFAPKLTTPRPPATETENPFLPDVAFFAVRSPITATRRDNMLSCPLSHPLCGVQSKNFLTKCFHSWKTPPSLKLRFTQTRIHDQCSPRNRMHSLHAHHNGGSRPSGHLVRKTLQRWLHATHLRHLICCVQPH